LTSEAPLGRRGDHPAIADSWPACGVLDASAGPTPAMVPAAVAPFTVLRVPPAPDAVPIAPEAVFETVSVAPDAVFETVPTAPEAVFETVSVAPETVFETGSVTPDAVFETVLVTVSTGSDVVFETVSTGFGTVVETVSTGFGTVVETVFVMVSTGSGVVLVTAETMGVSAVVTGAGSIGTSSANAGDGAHPRDTTTTVTHMMEKRCAPIDPFAMTRLPDGRPCPHGSHTPAHSFLTRKS
jgi:hypothetical protein